MAKVNKRSTLQVWGDVIFAIFLREIKSRFNDKLGISWAVLEPVAFIMILSLIRGRLGGGETHTMPTFMFMVYGMILIQLFLGTLNASATAIKKCKPLFAFRQVQPISAIIAIAGFELLVKLFVILMIIVISFFLQFELKMADSLMVIANIFQLWTIALSLGMIFGLAREWIQEIDKVRSVVLKPMFFISGVFFSLQDFTPEIWPYFNWNPVLHAIELSRDAAYPTFGAVGVSEVYLNITTITVLFFSLACYHISWKQAISR